MQSIIQYVELYVTHREMNALVLDIEVNALSEHRCFVSLIDIYKLTNLGIKPPLKNH